jgi:hypothetical protein
MKFSSAALAPMLGIRPRQLYVSFSVNACVSFLDVLHHLLMQRFFLMLVQGLRL